METTMINKKVLSLSGILILFLSISVFAAPVLQARACIDGPRMNGPAAGYGSITLESKDIAKTYEEIQKILPKYKAITRSYSTSTNLERRTRSIYAEFLVDPANGPLLLNDVASLGTVVSQNYNQNSSNSENLQGVRNELDSLREHINHYLTTAKPDIFILKIFVNKFMELENRLRSVESPSSQQAQTRINITLQLTGSSESGRIPVNTGLFSGNNTMTIVVCLLIGIVVGGLLGRWRIFGKKA
jgi:hypothetical protein